MTACIVLLALPLCVPNSKDIFVIGSEPSRSQHTGYVNILYLWLIHLIASQIMNGFFHQYAL